MAPSLNAQDAQETQCSDNQLCYSMFGLSATISCYENRTKTLFVITKTKQNKTGFPEWEAKLCSEAINYDHRGQLG
jgi:hypothetical protein